MKAALLKQSGSIKDLKKNLVIVDIPVPEISDDEVLINVKYASLNHRDLWIAQGLYSKISLPTILGSDCCGIINSKGSQVHNFRIGDEVIVNPGLKWGDNEDFQGKGFKILGMPDNGTFAEFVRVNKSNIYRKPDHLDFSEASSIPLAGVTAYRALINKSGISEHDKVLITGIGGGVSIFAMLFALKTGAKVFVTSGKNSKIGKAISFGAEAGVNYNDNDWDKKIMDLSDYRVNIIIDGAGGDTFAKCVDICNYGGTIVSYGATFGSVPDFKLHRLYWKQLKLFGSTMGSPKDFSEMIELIDKKKIVPVIDKVFSIENIQQAFERIATMTRFFLRSFMLPDCLRSAAFI